MQRVYGMKTSLALAVRTIAFIFLIVAAAAAQSRTAVVMEDAPIYVLPDTTRVPLRVVAVNTLLRVVEDAGEWYRVEFQDPQYGIRTGYIQAKQVRVERPELKPMELSVTKPAPSTDPVNLQAGANTEPKVAAQLRDDKPAASASSRRRTWVDVNFGLAMSGADDSIFTFSTLLIDRAAFYGKPSRGAEFDFGGGYMFSPVIGVGASVSGTAHRDIVGLGAGIGSTVLASGSTDKLTRTEGSVNFHAMMVPFESANLRVRLFGGPTYFRYEADMVYDFSFSQSSVTRYQIAKSDGTGWCLHVGGDATYFFSRVAGLGGFARYSRGTVSILEPLSEELQDMTLGGFQTGGGLRLRF
jgi:hypothetical protein